MPNFRDLRSYMCPRSKFVMCLAIAGVAVSTLGLRTSSCHLGWPYSTHNCGHCNWLMRRCLKNDAVQTIASAPWCPEYPIQAKHVRETLEDRARFMNMIIACVRSVRSMHTGGTTRLLLEIIHHTYYSISAHAICGKSSWWKTWKHHQLSLSWGICNSARNFLNCN